MCGADNEYRSKIVAALDKYKRSALPIKVRAIAKYLEGKLQAPTTCRDSLCAADVDFNR